MKENAKLNAISYAKTVLLQGGSEARLDKIQTAISHIVGDQEQCRHLLEVVPNGRFEGNSLAFSILRASIEAAGNIAEEREGGKRYAGKLINFWLARSVGPGGFQKNLGWELSSLKTGRNELGEKSAVSKRMQGVVLSEEVIYNQITRMLKQNRISLHENRLK